MHCNLGLESSVSTLEPRSQPACIRYSDCHVFEVSWALDTPHSGLVDALGKSIIRHGHRSEVRCLDQHLPCQQEAVGRAWFDWKP